MFNALLVDDEPLILEGLRYIVDWEEHGFELAGMAESAAEALDLIERGAVDLLVTDIRMPGLSGLELIERVRERRPGMKFVILSGYNDFELVRKAATLGIENYLIKPVNKEELSSTLVNAAGKLEQARRQAVQQVYVREAIDVLRDNVLLRMATGTIGIHEFAEKSAFLRIGLDGPACAVAIIRRVKDNLTGGDRSDPQLIAFAIRNICNDVLAAAATGEGIGGYAVDDNDEDIVLLLAGALADEKSVVRLLHELASHCVQYLKQEVFVSLGPPVENKFALAASYREAKDLADYSLVLADRGVLTSREAKAQQVGPGNPLQIDFDELQQALLAGDRDVVARHIRAVFAKLDGQEGTTPGLVHNVTVELLYRIVHATNLSPRSAAASPLGRNGFLAGVLGRRTLGDIADAIAEAADDLLAQSAARDSRIDEVLAYVNAHYAAELSLQHLSSVFHINAAYLGQQFKKETGKLFSTYLNEYRIAKAIELLQSSPLKAKEVAIKVGYSNPDYFYKIFKKITGSYPSEYG
ncbi:response regulator transcription factor [Cohnella fermenti]|uniref:Response regulator transcription factor n=1 Tax=Cohnella fermenti TaxID=2565925 RepID=A0A4S4BL24_9BACL|nr:response regulator transcription factor [Cohnella fermenti]THF75247.1 response regulator transcription factor [Cohnella fermenti]